MKSIPMTNDIMTNDKPGLSRVDGRLKVTGKAKYSAEYSVKGLVYGVLVGSTITKGSIKALDTKKAESAPGVLSVLTYLNAPKIPGYQTDSPTSKGPLKIFYNDQIYFNGQPIALVVANTFERALFAASLVSSTYNVEPHLTDLKSNLDKGFSTRKEDKDYVRGQEDAYKSASIKVEQEYIIPTEVHNPMELHAIIARWDADDKITVWDKTQGVKSTQRSIAQAFKIPPENVQVTSPFVGGAFGAALRTWPHEIAAVLAAKVLNKPVKLVLSRADMFTSVGYRPYTWQKVGIAATADGKLTGITHEATGQSSVYEDFTEGVVNISQLMYACPNVNTRYKLVSLNVNTPTPMRGPGEATGAFALECAMDELSYALNIDPIDLRIKNHADTDPLSGKPYSSKYLIDAYKMGADKIGWQDRNAKPASVTKDGWLVGYGMAAGMFGAHRSSATVMARMMADGTLILQTAVTDIGPGTGTAMVTVASETMGIPADKIRFDLGDSSLPPSPTQGGSQITSTVGSAVHDACVALKEKFQALAGTTDASNYTQILKQQNLDKLEVTTASKGGTEMGKYAMYSWSVHFMKVLVHPATGVVKIDKAISTADAGTIISAKTARSQMIGGTIMGTGMALMEEAVIDHRYGRLINNNFADYHVPVQADIPQIEAYFVNKPDPIINPIGAKGMGEIATIGVAAAIANAVYNATGKRVRDLPITPDKLI
ncbi:xanthine dehydrogenase family protein molybdopterin-binding subunit [Mucilaginibacter sp. OK098]|uniref:xanthine dehydrogenase family protein molybdopterin-binding subunit n=1 Tax=Mucilaginibacter sp. OK098 TaxID=1855297 RepID=UPI0009100EEB|nr:xanthine dehydrogenase family protein molybdopterin-binding subunit [Mucilaginibacter sp. OK098]SHM69137.1 xanthine dehydrogenase YagR molybdenum-binding subunit [Mucilaginibacter sp. OK098]